MEHWDGATWTDSSASVPGSAAPGMLASISCVNAVQCWAVGSTGSFNNGGSGPQPQSLVEYWDGSSWSVQPSPTVTALSFLNSISCVPNVACLADGSTLTTPNGNGDPGLRAFVEQLTFPPASSQGTVLAARDGGVFTYGTAAFKGSMGGQHLNAPIVGVATAPDGQGYWLVASDGGVFAFGTATFEGSMGGQHLNAPIVGMAPTRNGQGYWLVGADGGVFAFGAARFHGSMGGTHLNAAAVAMGATGHGGYWLVASDGGVFSFGGASFYGSAGGTRLSAPVTGMAASPGGQGTGWWPPTVVCLLTAMPDTSVPYRVKALLGNRQSSASLPLRQDRVTGWPERAAPCTRTVTRPFSAHRTRICWRRRCAGIATS